MKDKIPYFFPFVYFIKSRVPTLRHFAFHFYYEWIPAVFFLYLTASSWVYAIQNFLIFYLLFISFYELGYLLNDHYSIKHEDAPRLRSILLTRKELFVASFIRVSLFAILVVYTEIWRDNQFAVFYGILGVVFMAHNILSKNEYKVFTFLNLATLRYFAPFVFLIPQSLLLLILPSVLLNYVVYRSFTYMESKSLLIIPGRKSAHFKLAYYTIIIPLSILLAVFFESNLPVYINFYYLFFWIVFWVMENRGKRKAV